MKAQCYRPRSSAGLVFAFSFLALAAGWLIATPVYAAPTDIFNNLLEPYAGSMGVGNTSWQAQAFTTGGSLSMITGITVTLANFSQIPGQFAVEIWDSNGAGGRPGAKVADVASNVNAIAYAHSQIPFEPLSIVLNSGTTYYVVLRGKTLSGFIFWDLTSSQTGLGSPSNQSSYNGTSWTLPSLDLGPFLMQIVADTPPACVSTGSTNWSSTSTWSCGHAPTSIESFAIKAGHTVTLDVNATTNSAVLLTGNIDTGANTLTLGAAATVSGTGDISGTVRRTSPATGVPLQFNNENTTITFATAPTQIDVKLNKSKPSIFARAVNRYYTLTPTGSVSATLQLAYRANEVPSAPFNESNNVLWRYDPTLGQWVMQGGSVVTTTHYISLAHVSQFSDWAFSDDGTPVASNNADLSNLTLSSGTLMPGFSTGITSYTATVANNISSITVTPTVSDTHASVKVNGTPVSSGTASPPITLSVGANPITTTVTAQDGTTKKDYVVTVTRAASSNADLSDLALSNGILTPSFAANTTSYTATVANNISSITVTPTVSDTNATVKVNGVNVTSGIPSDAISLIVGANPITTTVTAQDSTTKTYTVTVTRNGVVFRLYLPLVKR